MAVSLVGSEKTYIKDARQLLKKLKILVSSSTDHLLCWNIFFNLTYLTSQMQLTLPSVFLLLATMVSSASVHSARQQQCAEASRFGEVSITPNTVVPGDVRAFRLTSVLKLDKLITCGLDCDDQSRLYMFVQLWDWTQIHGLPHRGTSQQQWTWTPYPPCPPWTFSFG